MEILVLVLVLLVLITEDGNSDEAREKGGGLVSFGSTAGAGVISAGFRPVLIL